MNNPNNERIELAKYSEDDYKTKKVTGIVSVILGIVATLLAAIGVVFGVLAYKANQDIQLQQGEQGVVIEKVEYDDNGDLKITFTDGSTQTIVMPDKHVHTFGDWISFTTDDVSCEDRIFYHICSSCNEIVWKNGAYEDHSWAKEYSHDNTYHWFDCETCDEVNAKSEHTVDETGVCTTCEKILAQGLLFEVTSGYITITGYEGTATEVVIPSRLGAYTVKAIGEKAFENQTALTSLTLPTTIVSIGTRAFYGCTGLTEFTIPSSVTSIDTQIFYKCDALNTVYYNSSYSSNKNSFLSLPHIKKVVFGGTSIPAYILKDSAVNEVEILNSVTSIGYEAFYNCAALTEIKYNATKCADFSYDKSVFDGAGQSREGIVVTIGANVKKIPSYFFYPSNISYSPKVKTVVFEEGAVCESIGDYAFYFCSSLTNIGIPDSVTTIGSYAFSRCSSLTSIAIPDSVTSIGYEEFYQCYSLMSVEIPDSVTSIAEKAFYNCSSLTSIEIPDSVTSIGSGAFSDCDSLTSIEIPDSVTSIGGSAFSGCDNLTSIEIPDSVTWIGVSVFSSCSSLTSVVIGDILTSIAEKAFYNCDNLTSVVIGDSVTSIGASAFSGCSSLTNIEIPDILTSIGYDAFYNCSSLTNIEIPDSVTSIGRYVFSGCSSLTNIEIPDSVTSIGSYAFSNCSSLTSVVIGDSVTTIGERAFSYCTSLTSVVIGDSVTTIGSSAFYNCYRLVEVVNNSPNITVTKGSESNGYIGYYALGVYNSGDTYVSKFSNDNGYIVYTDGEEKILVGYFGEETELVLPSYITKINQYAFSRCSSLTSVEIPDSVTTIGSFAFYSCSSLTIYCEAESKPSGWNYDWNYSNCPVVWGYTEEE